MKLSGKSSNALILAMLGVAALAVAFWMLLLQPKREEAAKLGEDVERVESSLAAHRAEVAEAEEAKREFPAQYRKLVVLGKAVPGDDDTASLLVQVSGIAERTKVEFKDIELSADGSGGEEAPAPTPAPGGTPVSATEAAASVLPLGASIGPAGLGVMPYSLTFDGSFFQIADFIKGLDALVKTDEEQVAVDGRLLTLDGFSLAADPATGFPDLQADFAVTTYLTPPTEGIAAGATPESPGSTEATPASATLGGTP
jgi:Tfp pilus assembly protein PilO